MIHLFLNCSAATAGGGLTYARNVVPRLSGRSGVRSTIVASPTLREEIGEWPNVSWISLDATSSPLRRLWQEQTALPKLIKESAADVLISAGNFALRKSPVPQILLSGNSLYTSSDFRHDLRSRGEYRLLLDTCLKGFGARCSVAWADCTVAPSHAFAKDLERWTNRPVTSIYHGFNRDLFFRNGNPLPLDLEQKFVVPPDTLRLLLVSHYNYYRNFETLIRALPLINEQLQRPVKLFLTCKLDSRQNPGSYRAEPAAALVRELGVGDRMVELGAVPYDLLHRVYRSCDIYVTAAYAETFAHPLVEAMACGLPVVASDLAVHGEICGDAAVYFDRFSPWNLATQVLRVANSPALASRMKEAGRRRALAFSWDQHLDQLIALANHVFAAKRATNDCPGEYVSAIATPR